MSSTKSEEVQYVDAERLIKLFKDGKSRMVCLHQMLSDRAMLEQQYSQALDHWTKKYRRKLSRYQLTTHDDMLYAVKYLLLEGSRVANSHRARHARLVQKGGCIPRMKEWLRQGYGHVTTADEPSSPQGTDVDGDLGEYKRFVESFLEVVRECKKAKQAYDTVGTEVRLLQEKYNEKTAKHGNQTLYAPRLRKLHALLVQAHARHDLARTKYHKWDTKLKATQESFVQGAQERSTELLRFEVERARLVAQQLAQALEDLTSRSSDIEEVERQLKYIREIGHDAAVDKWRQRNISAIRGSQMQIESVCLVPPSAVPPSLPTFPGESVAATLVASMSADDSRPADAARLRHRTGQQRALSVEDIRDAAALWPAEGARVDEDCDDSASDGPKPDMDQKPAEVAHSSETGTLSYLAGRESVGTQYTEPNSSRRLTSVSSEDDDLSVIELEEVRQGAKNTEQYPPVVPRGGTRSQHPPVRAKYELLPPGENYLQMDTQRREGNTEQKAKPTAAKQTKPTAFRPITNFLGSLNHFRKPKEPKDHEVTYTEVQPFDPSILSDDSF